MSIEITNKTRLHCPFDGARLVRERYEVDADGFVWWDGYCYQCKRHWKTTVTADRGHGQSINMNFWTLSEA